MKSFLKPKKTLGDELVQFAKNECGKTQQSCNVVLTKMNENLTDLLAPILDKVGAVESQKKKKLARFAKVCSSCNRNWGYAQSFSGQN